MLGGGNYFSPTFGEGLSYIPVEVHQIDTFELGRQLNSSSLLLVQTDKKSVMQLSVSNSGAVPCFASPDMAILSYPIFNHIQLCPASRYIREGLSDG